MELENPVVECEPRLASVSPAMIVRNGVTVVGWGAQEVAFARTDGKTNPIHLDGLHGGLTTTQKHQENHQPKGGPRFFKI